MKANFFILLLSFVALISCDSTDNTTRNVTTDYYPEPEYFTEQESVSSICGNCNGNGGWYDAYGNVAVCPVCHGAGTTISFRSRRAYYAECSHHSYCKIYQRTSASDSDCKTCGCPKISHIKRYE